VVKDLSAERVGDAVHLRWTTPDQTTDRIAIKGTLTAEICRINLSAQPSPVCAPVGRLAVKSGVSQTVDTLPTVLTVDPPALLAYRVQILNAHGRSAGPSPEFFVASGSAPPPVEQLRATPARDGATLEWQHRDTAAVVELDRQPIGPDGVAIEPAQRKPAPKATSKPVVKTNEGRTRGPGSEKPFAPSAAAPTEVKLRTPAQSTDPGGTIDRTAQRGDTYRYTAQRVRIVTLDGHTLEIRSAVSPPMTLVMRDIFPPHAPAGLEAAPGGTDHSIDLSWTPNTDSGLAGYSVYRQEIDSQGVAAGTAARLNTTLVVGPAYRDQTAMAGHRYAYRVAAVDTAGNESAPSDPVQETSREQ
jgi:hypothetical protein